MDEPDVIAAQPAPRRKRQRPSGNPPERPKTLHGRRKGKTLRSIPAQLVGQLLPSLAIDLTSGPLKLEALFPRPMRELRLEIGFGGGERLAREAAADPDVGHLGCEPFLNGVAKALHAIGERDLDNVRIHPGDAGDLLDALPVAALDRVEILYPDPWPKRRQRKRRFISQRSLAQLARAMRSGAVLRFATDIDDYAGWTLAHLARSPDFVWNAVSAADWRSPWEGWTPTRYEMKAIAEGRPSVYLTFVRV